MYKSAQYYAFVFDLDEFREQRGSAEMILQKKV